MMTVGSLSVKRRSGDSPRTPRIERVERYPDSAALVAMPSPVEHTRHGTVVVVPIARGAPEENEKFLAREHARVDLEEHALRR